MARLQILLRGLLCLSEASDPGPNWEQPSVKVHGRLQQLHVATHKIEFNPFLESLRILECLRFGQHSGNMTRACILAVVGMTHPPLTKDSRIHSATGCEKSQQLQEGIVFALRCGIVSEATKMQWHAHATISQALGNHQTKSGASNIK